MKIILLLSIFSMGESKTLLKMPTAFNTSLPILGSTVSHLKKQVEESSDGSLKIKIYAPGKLLPPFEILDGVSTGKVNSGYAISGYWQGKILSAAIFSSLPFGPSAPEFLAWLKFGGGMELYQEMYDKHGYNVKVLACGISPPESSGWFTKPIRSIKDLKGLKIRFYGLGGEVMRKLGASPSLIPGGEIFPALEKKAIDATEYSMPVVDQKLGFYKVAKYNYFPGWHQQSTVFELLINKKFWKKMSKAHRSLLEMACNDAITYSMAQGEALQFKVMKQFKDKHGVKIKKWSPKMLAQFEKAWRQVAKDLSAKDPFFKKVYNHLQKFREGYRIWQSHAFLPRKK
ncbi:MAG: TRAP transporter substrate-binding protein [Halobacteriovoraceae bacterium]|nr:TRAP transporter substrate-binding protein [Halobacteriovoraceae bacterium]